MTGPEHYREAERLLEAAKTDWRDTANDHVAATLVEARVLVALTAANVHAQLAQAAASAEPCVQRYYGDEAGTDRAWAQVVS